MMSEQELAVETPTAEIENTAETAPDTPDVAETVAAPAQEADAPTAEASGEEEFSIRTLKPGDKLTATVKNIVDFGAFVDIGLPQDGLVHISELSRRKVEKVTDVVSEGDKVDVWVKRVDVKRGRISLTMKKPISRRFKDIKEGDEFEGVVTRLEPYGAFIDIDSDREGLVHISQITHEYINHPEEALTIGQRVPVKVLKINRKKRQVDLSIKEMLPPPPEPEAPKEQKAGRSRNQGREEAPAEESATSEEPMPTAMAVAFAAFQQQFGGSLSRSRKRTTKVSRVPKEELDAVISGTLAREG
ncbi:MAG: S1 RNA-binding domain-containing protein [Chloroflexi bacterium]|nr:MAG: S1 RNA-binding domain-containing protein [Chloroflexota bacterium]